MGEPTSSTTDSGTCDAPSESVRMVRPQTANAVLPHAFRILVAEGASALTPQRLHKESGVARTTIYRNWPTTADVIGDLLARATSTAMIPEFTGHLATDLGIAVDSLVHRFNNRPVRQFFAALVDVDRSSNNGDLAAQFIKGMVAPARRALVHAVDRGELQVDDVDIALRELTDSLVVRHLIYAETVTSNDGTRAVSDFINRHR